MAIEDLAVRDALGDLYDQLADLQERLAAWEAVMPLVLEALQGLSQDNAQIQGRLTAQQLRQLGDIHKAYGIGGN